MWWNSQPQHPSRRSCPCWRRPHTHCKAPPPFTPPRGGLWIICQNQNQGTGFDNVGHRLGIATRTQISACKLLFLSAGAAVSMFHWKDWTWWCPLPLSDNWLWKGRHWIPVFLFFTVSYKWKEKNSMTQGRRADTAKVTTEKQLSFDCDNVRRPTGYLAQIVTELVWCFRISDIWKSNGQHLQYPDHTHIPVCHSSPCKTDNH